MIVQRLGPDNSPELGRAAARLAWGYTAAVAATIVILGFLVGSVASAAVTTVYTSTGTNYWTTTAANHRQMFETDFGLPANQYVYSFKVYFKNTHGSNTCSGASFRPYGNYSTSDAARYYGNTTVVADLGPSTTAATTFTFDLTDISEEHDGDAATYYVGVERVAAGTNCGTDDFFIVGNSASTVADTEWISANYDLQGEIKFGTLGDLGGFEISTMTSTATDTTIDVDATVNDDAYFWLAWGLTDCGDPEDPDCDWDNYVALGTPSAPLSVIDATISELAADKDYYVQLVAFRASAPAQLDWITQQVTTSKPSVQLTEPTDCDFWGGVWGTPEAGDGLACLWSWIGYVVTPHGDIIGDHLSDAIDAIADTRPFSYLLAPLNAIATGLEEAADCADLATDIDIDGVEMSICDGLTQFTGYNTHANVQAAFRTIGAVAFIFLIIMVLRFLI